MCFRINNDLLLWEPLAPAPLGNPEGYSMAGPGGGWGLDLATHLMQQQQQQQQGHQQSGQPDKFVMCKSGIQYGKKLCIF